MVRRRNHLNQLSRGFLKPLVIFLLMLGLVAFYFVARINLVWTNPNSESTTRVSVTIKPGTSLKGIAAQLYDSEIIKDALAFEWFVRWNGLSAGLQAGDYVIQRNLTMAEITEVLQAGRSKEMRITIPEGFTVQQIDALLARLNLSEPGAFAKCAATCDLGFQISNLEGYLFPSTYYEPISTFSNKKFIQRLYQTFQNQTASFNEGVIDSGRTLDQIVNVASMIEREAFGSNFEEKALISGVIWKRLDEGIALGIDATTRYELNDWTNPLYAADLQRKTPYNTRLNRGLPPTPISNPGIDALKAAVYPQKSEYYYYLHDKTGKIRFGRTLDEHNENKRRYLY